MKGQPVGVYMAMMTMFNERCEMCEGFAPNVEEAFREEEPSTYPTPEVDILEDEMPYLGRGKIMAHYHTSKKTRKTGTGSVGLCRGVPGDQAKPGQGAVNMDAQIQIPDSDAYEGLFAV